MKCLAVLSHRMSKDCNLGVESIARSRLAIGKFTEENYEFLITIGWAYRADCTTPISDVVRDFILDNSDIEQTSIISFNSSRDTVGDAYYCLEFLHKTPISEVHVVTSDYHIKRAELIFNKIFNNRLKVKVFGAKTDAVNDYLILLHEEQSINAFNLTFAPSDFLSIKSIFSKLSSKHPFYNGEIYPKI